MSTTFKKAMKQKLLDLKEQILTLLVSESDEFQEIVDDMEPKDLADIAADDIDRRILEVLGSQEIKRLQLIDSALGRMENGDYVIFYDIRGEREIQITESLIQPDFAHFPIKDDTVMNFVTMIEYSSELNVKVAFPPVGKIHNTLAEVVSNASIRLCKISESEKAVHVGYFMNSLVTINRRLLKRIY